ncbi:MAG: phenylacetate--CoA ligase family protein [Anaerolineae bacterium]
MARLKRQLDYVYQCSPFYRMRFDAAGVSPGDVRSLADIRRLPLLTKEDLLADQEGQPPYGARLCVSEDKIAMLILTSGTSGVGQEAYAMTRLDVEFGGSAWTNWYYRCGLRKGDQILLTWPLGTNSGPQGAFLGAYKLGANTLPIAPYDSRSKLQTYLLKFNPAGIVVTPAYLSHLTVLCEELGIDPKQQFRNLKAIMIATEAYPTSWAQRMESIWGTRLYELYGNTQQGGLAAGCCEAGVLTEDGGRGCLHLDEWSTLFEVIDPETHEPVAPGEVGELVLTNLFREGSPLVRFRTKDRVRFLPHTSCTCGRPTDCIEAGTVARYDDMMKIRAQNVWPEAVDSLILAHPEIEEYQGRVYVDDRGREQVEVKIEFKVGLLTEEAKRRLLNNLTAELRRGVGISMDLSEAPAGSLERFVFKTRRWTDERKKGLERVLHTAAGARKE